MGEEEPFPGIERLNAMSEADFATAVAPLFEGAPRFLQRLAQRRPFAFDDELVGTAREAAHAMPEDEQLELIAAHPRLSRSESRATVGTPGQSTPRTPKTPMRSPPASRPTWARSWRC